ncbi:MAG: group 1 truncated hemoglobin [Myxococcota bacterium]
MQVGITQAAMTMTPFERLGGETVLKRVIDDFVERIFADVMIGFFFRDASKARIKMFEYQLAAEFLGAPVVYGGRPLDAAHRRHPIMGGQFARRKQILMETLQEHEIPADIIDSWMEHTESLRPLVTQDRGSDCDPELAMRGVLSNETKKIPKKI